MNEYRAIFSSPHGGPGSRGPVRASLKEASEDKPERPEETHEYLSGIEVRRADPWTALSLRELFDKVKKP